MIVSVTGTPGSFKELICKWLKDELSADLFLNKDVVQEYLNQTGISKEVFVRSSVHAHSVDKGVATAIASSPDNNVVIDRPCIFTEIPLCFKIFLYCNRHRAAIRYSQDMNITTAKATKLLEDNDKKLTQECSGIYDINVYNLSYYDLVIDTTYASLEEVKDILLDALSKVKAGTFKSTNFICCRSIVPTVILSRMSDDTLEGKVSGKPVICIGMGDFYCIANHNALLDDMQSRKTFSECQILEQASLTVLSDNRRYEIEDATGYSYSEFGGCMCKYEVDYIRFLTEWLRSKGIPEDKYEETVERLCEEHHVQTKEELVHKLQEVIL